MFLILYSCCFFLIKQISTFLKITKTIDARACAAAGQNGLMTMYSEMFSQYNINTAQVGSSC